MLESENKRRQKANSKKQHRKINGSRQAPFRQALDAMPKPADEEHGDDFRQPSVDCERGKWVGWAKPLGAHDNRKANIFGLPPGFKSLVDGSVVAAGYFHYVSRNQPPQ